MRDSIVNSTPMEILSFNGLQTPYNNGSDEGKPIINVSSNVYYGYQPLRVHNSSAEPKTQDSNKPIEEMDVTQCESHLINRKRPRDNTHLSNEKPKKRRQNEPLMPDPPKFSPTKIYLDEDLLRETHGCSYYHWISSSI